MPILVMEKIHEWPSKKAKSFYFYYILMPRRYLLFHFQRLQFGELIMMLPIHCGISVCVCASTYSTMNISMNG